MHFPEKNEHLPSSNKNRPMTQPEFHTSASPEKEATAYLAETLKHELVGGKKVLWLLSGGSAVLVAQKTAEALQGIDMSNLTVTLIDERYGDVGHTDSNWTKLQNAGFFLPGAMLHPVLTGESKETTSKQFAVFLENALRENEYKIGLFGIGIDGHTAGILPHSPAVADTRLVVGYTTETHERITTTPALIRELDEAVVYAAGDEKKQTLEMLKGDYSIDEQPAQALKQAKKFIIFND